MLYANTELTEKISSIMQTQNEEFLTIHPKNEIISKHIKFYYFHKSLDNNFKKNIIYHPHYLTTLNIYKGVKIELSDSGRTYVPDNSKKLSVTYTINKKTSKEVRLRGQFDKIGVIFKPLGINHFIDLPLSTIIRSDINYFDYFGDDLHQVSTEVFQTNAIEIKRELLDDFFLNQFIKFNDYRVIKAVEHIYNSESSVNTENLAKLLNISRETLLRVFKKHLCYSFEEFKSVIQFRRALEYYDGTLIKPKLTNVAIDNQYYDQSAFIKHFKKITGNSPKKFFSLLRNISNSGTYWTFKD